MSRVKNEALNLVKNGNWVFDLLLPVFVSELELQTNKSGLNLSLTQLTLVVYLQISQIKSTQFPEVITKNSFENEKMFQLIAEKVYSGGMASNFSELEIQTIKKTSLTFLNLSPELFRLSQYVFTGLFRIRNNNFSGASFPHAFGIYFLSVSSL